MTLHAFPPFALLVAALPLLAGAAPRQAAGEPIEPDALDLGEARDVTGEGLAFVEVEADPDTAFVGQQVSVRARFGFQRRLREERLIQLFHRELDVPAQLRAPWLEEAREPWPPSATGRSVALGSRVVLAHALEPRAGEGDDVFDVYEIERTLVPGAPGEFRLEAPRLRFAFAESFREDIFQGRVPEERTEAVVRGEERVLTVLPLPEEGRPPDFTGAIGSFSAAAAVRPRAVVLGDSVRLTLRIAGTGSLAGARAPRFPPTSDFELRGVLEEPVEDGRAFVYDLLPRRSGSLEVPPLAFPYFDPSSSDPSATAGYRAARTSALPLVVRAPDREPAATEEVGETPAPGRGAIAITSGAVAALGLALLGAWIVRAGRRARPSADALRIRAAAREFLGERGRGDDGTGDAFLAFLARALDRPASAVVGPDLAERLHAAGIDAELARRAAAQLDELLAPRYGGPPPRDGERSARALVEEIDAGLADARRPG